MRWLKYIRKVGKAVALLSETVDILETTIVVLSDKKVSDQEVVIIRNKLSLLLNKIKDLL